MKIELKFISFELLFVANLCNVLKLSAFETVLNEVKVVKAD